MQTRESLGRTEGPEEGLGNNLAEGRLEELLLCYYSSVQVSLVFISLCTIYSTIISIDNSIAN